MSEQTAEAIPNWTVMVLLSEKKRVRHLAVFAPTAAPLCRNRGDFPHYGQLHDFPGVPICTRCTEEARMLTRAIEIAE